MLRPWAALIVDRIERVVSMLLIVDRIVRKLESNVDELRRIASLEQMQSTARDQDEIPWLEQEPPLVTGRLAASSPQDARTSYGQPNYVRAVEVQGFV